jgi:hypothetical protein
MRRKKWPKYAKHFSAQCFLNNVVQHRKNIFHELHIEVVQESEIWHDDER